MPVPASAPEGTPKMPLPQLFPPSERTVPRMLQLQAERHGQRRLVALGGITLTYMRQRTPRPAMRQRLPQPASSPATASPSCAATAPSFF